MSFDERLELLQWILCCCGCGAWRVWLARDGFVDTASSVFIVIPLIPIGPVSSCEVVVLVEQREGGGGEGFLFGKLPEELGEVGGVS